MRYIEHGKYQPIGGTCKEDAHAVGKGGGGLCRHLLKSKQLRQDVEQCFNSGGLIFLDEADAPFHDISFIGSDVLEEFKGVVLEAGEE